MSLFTRRSRRPATLFAAILTMTCLLVAEDGAAATFALQAEDGEVVRGLSVSNRSGFTGTGFVDLVNEPGSYVEWVIDMSDAAAASTLAFRFANGATTHRKLKILVNGVSALPGNLICPPTGSWSTWRTKTVTGVALRKGLNSIRVESVTATAAPISIRSSSPPKPSSRCSIGRRRSSIRRSTSVTRIQHCLARQTRRGGLALPARVVSAGAVSRLPAHR